MSDASAPPQRDPFTEVFRSYEQARPRLQAQEDSRTRAPAVFGAVWDALGCRPAADRTVLVTGSKGKGTTARLIAWNLQRAGHRVGLVVSPEELGHLDRIRIDNVPIAAPVFAQALARCLPLLQRQLAAQAPERYLSPTGIFLSVALQWFAAEAVDWIVVEGGRGVRWDEIGQLRARLALVTSVLDEHVAALGGTREQVLRDKLAIAQQAPVTVVDPDVAVQARAAGLALPGLLVAEAADAGMASGQPVPAWYARLCALARTGLRALEHRPPFVPMPSPSFAWLRCGAVPVLCEPVIHGASVDAGFLRTQLPAGTRVLLGLSDDKDVAGVQAALRGAGLADIGALALTSRIGHVASRWLDRADAGAARLGALDVIEPDLDALRARLHDLAAGAPALYVVGVQLFVRCVRQALAPGLAGPGPADPFLHVRTMASA